MSGMCADLGQVKYVLSDKTGTAVLYCTVVCGKIEIMTIYLSYCMI
jgi:hypothetical protein